MIVGIGCDIVSHSSTFDLKWDTNAAIRSGIFSEKELLLYAPSQGIRFLAGRFAAKEAILKCIGTGMQDGISLKEIEILKDTYGKPTVNLTGEVKSLSEKAGITDFFISISHCDNYSIAYALGQR